MDSFKKLIVILGPTAVGKTALSLYLAKKLNTEIISGDSMLVYRGFDIGSAKPSLNELKEVKHHLVDILEPNDTYNVMDFCGAAGKIIEKLNNDEKIPILAGGTGLYIKALLEGYEFSERGQKSVDSFYSKTNNLVYDAYVIGLRRERAALYERIEKRVDIMVNAGLFDEVEQLLKVVTKDAQSIRGIGYKEAARYFNGEITEDEAIDEIKKSTRHFAKRQFTWYKKMPYINWYDIDNLSDNGIFDMVYADVEKFLRGEIKCADLKL